MEMVLNGKKCSISVAGPMCLGAEYPEFDEFKVNESKIPFGMRFKEFSARQTGEKTMKINWMTQSCWDDEDLGYFLDEVRRWGAAWGLSGVTCSVFLEDRDYEMKDEREITW